ncbi:peptidoglycan-binding protein LysM [Flavobacterium sp. DG1-102-2]|uniref:peptidoglycan-binding protein LysM n=1 Tax=Flavobacterium sp. DG1-102-2 TaxID=3081663 RepID=UPI002949FC84|nr:peptidoglycan-binding protein LysM [Flavobacterium sp. DG1-102-2]MDV6168698.1 peptidoglycan-binding protein LysM [Flavobacterium sp. DG1-102-2]
MIKKWIYFLGLTLFITLVSSGFRPNEAKQFGKIEGFHLADDEITNYTVPTIDETAKVNFNFPFTGKSYVGFKQAVAIKESQGLYKLVNRFGYMGKYQFGKSALRALGIKNNKEFLNNPRLQERAFKALLAKNKWELRKEIHRYDGHIIKGVKITESGLLAAAHLAGAGSVKSFLSSNGKRGFKDGFGTSLKTYIRKFGGYDTSGIVAHPQPKVVM